MGRQRLGEGLAVPGQPRHDLADGQLVVQHCALGPDEAHHRFGGREEVGDDLAVEHRDPPLAGVPADEPVLP
ncbi:hypothetical protein AB4212_17030 [Streptomyces sp. 2MCAF27]